MQSIILGVNTFIEAVIEDSNPAKRSIDGIQIITFDDYIKEKSIGNVGLIKIDTEGYEYFILKGMRSFLMENKPPIICEVNNYAHKKMGKDLSLLKNYMKSLSYEAFSIKDETKLVDITEIELWDDVIFLPIS